MELRPRAGTDALTLGGAFGVVHYGILLLWIAPALAAETALAPAAYVLVATAAAIVPAASVEAAHRLRYGLGVPPWLALATAWVAGEWLRAHLGPLSFPWLGLAASVSDHPLLLAPAAWLGERGIAFGLVAANVVWATLLIPVRPSAVGRRRRLLPAAIGALVVAGTVWAGARGPSGGATDVIGPRLRVAVVSTDYPRGGTPDAPTATERVDWMALELESAGPVDLVVLPEAFIPIPWGQTPLVGRAVRAAAERLQAPFVLGTLREDSAGGVHNSVVSVTPSQQNFVDKDKRVPWVESGFASGTGARPLEVGDHSLAVLICFEAAFGGYARRLTRDGGLPIMNLTSDAWFPARGVGSWGRAQQMAHLPLRAVENGTAVLRVANRGVSVWYDSRGRVRGSSQRPGVEVFSVYSGSTPTLFGRTGDVLGPLALFLTLIAMFRGAVEPLGSETLY